MWVFLGWVAIVCLAIVIVVITVLLVVAVVRSILSPEPKSKAKTERVI